MEILAFPGFVWSWDEAWEGAGLTPVVGKHLRKHGQGPSMTVRIVKATPPQPGQLQLAIVEGKEAAIVVKQEANPDRPSAELEL